MLLGSAALWTQSLHLEALVTAGLRAGNKMKIIWKLKGLVLLVLCAITFYVDFVWRSLQLSRVCHVELDGLYESWLFPPRRNDLSDAQWRNFHENLLHLTFFFGVFVLVAYGSRMIFNLKARGMSRVWLLSSLIYLYYLHSACVIFVLTIASLNFLLVKIFARKRYFPYVLWPFNSFFLLFSRVYDGFLFSTFGEHWAYLDDSRGTFRWQICFNLVFLRLISYGYDYHWAHEDSHSHFDEEKHVQRCQICKSGKTCYRRLQEKNVDDDFSFITYICYLLYAPLYIAGPIVSFNAFASQLVVPQNRYSFADIIWYGLRWLFSLVIMEVMTHQFHFNAFGNSSWKQLTPMETLVIGYGVLIFMWLKFLLIWRYFRFWSLIAGIEAPENMHKCVNNCHSLESFWKNWHSSFNKWIVRYMYIPLGGSQRKLFNIWPIFAFVAIWHDPEWKLLYWAGLTCLFFVLEIFVKSAANALQAGNDVHRELSAATGVIMIACLMVAIHVGFVSGLSGINELVDQFLTKQGLSAVCYMLSTFYIGTKLMFQIQQVEERRAEYHSDYICVLLFVFCFFFMWVNHPYRENCTD